MTAGASAAALVTGPAHDDHQVHEPSRRAGRTYPLSGGAAAFWTRSRVPRRHSRGGDGDGRRAKAAVTSGESRLGHRESLASGRVADRTVPVDRDATGLNRE